MAPPQPGEDEPESDQAAKTGFQFTPGDNFIFDTEPTSRRIWGESDQVLWADGEALIIAAPQGLGKTTLAQQLALGWIGIPGYSSPARLPNHIRHPGHVPGDGQAPTSRPIIPRMVGEEHRAQLHEHLTVCKDRRPVTSPNTHPCCRNSASRRAPTR